MKHKVNLAEQIEIPKKKHLLKTKRKNKQHKIFKPLLYEYHFIKSPNLLLYDFIKTNSLKLATFPYGAIIKLTNTLPYFINRYLISAPCI